MFMLRKCSAILLILGIMLVVGCAAHVHKVGDGARGNDMMQARQWYVLFGLVPLNEVSTNTMAGGATDYEIKTEYTVLDFIINAFAGVVSSRTVTVTK